MLRTEAVTAAARARRVLDDGRRRYGALGVRGTCRGGRGAYQGLVGGLARAERPVIVGEASGRRRPGVHGHGGGGAPPARSSGLWHVRAKQRKQTQLLVLLARLGVLWSEGKQRGPI